jgi:hypothetical protein
MQVVKRNCCAAAERFGAALCGSFHLCTINRRNQKG